MKKIVKIDVYGLLNCLRKLKVLYLYVLVADYYISSYADRGVCGIYNFMPVLQYRIQELRGLMEMYYS